MLRKRASVSAALKLPVRVVAQQTAQQQAAAEEQEGEVAGEQEAARPDGIPTSQLPGTPTAYGRLLPLRLHVDHDGIMEEL